jgi:hypothetical protein
MKKFTIKVPYSEMTYGTTTYVVWADTKEEAEALIEKDSYTYYYDTEQHYSEYYDECWDDAEWKEEE